MLPRILVCRDLIALVPRRLVRPGEGFVNVDARSSCPVFYRPCAARVGLIWNVPKIRVTCRLSGRLLSNQECVR
ncbi:hypothetical protein BG57_11170 [Caballeronia grimmiae]|uniref:Uncharacterized protein n=1 Tax=Caballeronia grimmiae TaxID=1071679 RepID=A0A069PB21_9BURK|nr:hypothetical protein BG57_11170 [Caballeronia grimmiae]